MTDREFDWFHHLITQVLPALAEHLGVRMETPEHNLQDENYWYIPLGHLRHIDERLTEADVQYQSLQLSEYM